MDRRRMQIVVRGAVQGVGFRPAVYRVATGLDLAGWVSNTADGVEIDIEGRADAVARFVTELLAAVPAHAVVHGLETRALDPVGQRGFEVRASRTGTRSTALVLPDIATCDECLRELFDPADHRYRYPFINCTHCGPRFTIIESLPYDRERTTMARFTMCPRCQAEYDDPADRRFHAQPNACPECGPQLEAWNGTGGRVAGRDEALGAAVDAIRSGGIVAVKGIGGFHLVCDARDEAAVRELRDRKRRERKPLAVMFPDLAAVREACVVGPLEERLLAAPEAPIVLLRRRRDELAPSVAPRNPSIGAILPYTPLHHLMLRSLAHPVVATSGNLTDEPIATDETEALERLAGVADLFLVHDRPIARYADDSILRVVGGRPMLLRRARGYAPLPLARADVGDGVLAVGAHLKSTIGLTVDGRLLLSHHLGDLDTPRALEAFHEAARWLPRIYGQPATLVVHDLHPDYASTQFAQSLGVPGLGVQHHHAHVLACMADNELDGEVLGVSWDGTGLGNDHTSWGGEFLRVRQGGFHRAAHLRTFALPGGDSAARDARRSALGVLYECGGEVVFAREAWMERLAFAHDELPVLRTMLATGTGVVRTSSAGRLFDAVSALLGLCLRSTFEGEAAMEVEFAASGVEDDGVYPFRLDGECVDWAPMIEAMEAGRGAGWSAPLLSRRFLNTLAEMIAAVARREGIPRVCLTGGCFQNRILCETAIERLRAAGFTPYWHQRVPPNDGGIALGQLVAASQAGAARRGTTA